MNSVTTEESQEEKPKPKPKGVRGLRGLARKKSAVTSLVKDDAEETGLYSGCVKKCFNAIKSHEFSEDVIQALKNTQDVKEDDMFKVNSKKKSPPVLYTVSVSDDEKEAENETDDEKEADNEIEDRCIVTENTNNNNNEVSASPPPPPSLPKGQKRPKPRATKTSKKLMSAVESFTQSISDAQSSKLNTSSDLLQSPDIDLCLDDDVTVRVSIHGKIQRYIMSSDAPFSTIMSQIASKEAVDERLVMLVHNDRTLRTDDTPTSVKLHVADILECHITQTLEDSFTQEPAEQNDEDLIELVVQSRESKRREMIKAHMKKPLQILIDEYARRMNIEADYVQIFFDGMPVVPSDTPEGLDMEEGDMLDVKDAAPVIVL